MTTIFLNLGYPEFIVQRTIKRTLERSSEPERYGPAKCPVYLRLPFIGPVSGRFETQLKNSVHKTFGSVTLKVVFRTEKSIYVASKDVSPTQEKSNVIYYFKCHCDRAYVGRTSQRFHKRRDDHVPNNIRKWMLDQTTKKPSASYFTAIGKHLLSNPECARHYKDDMFSIMSRDRNQFHLRLRRWSLYLLKQ